MLSDKNKGKIVIHMDMENDRINSRMEYRGIAKKPEVALTTLLVNFVSLSLEKGKDPEELIKKHLPVVISMLQKGRTI